MRLGADDYLTKDASLPHLAARIAALSAGALSRPPVASRTIVGADRCGSTPAPHRRLEDRRAWIHVTEFWMVHALARHLGHVRDRDALMRDANIVVDDSTITSHVKRIRRKFMAVDAAFDRIDTVYGMGYRWRE